MNGGIIVLIIFIVLGLIAFISLGNDKLAPRRSAECAHEHCVARFVCSGNRKYCALHKNGQNKNKGRRKVEGRLEEYKIPKSK